MTIDEFSDGFDVLLNSYNSKTPFGDSPSVGIVLDEYEKSVLLTEAQDQIVIELYTGRNERRASFEKTEELRTYLRPLIRTHICEEVNVSSAKLCEESKLFKLPPDNLFITYESATLDDSKAGCMNNRIISVIPSTQDDFHHISKNPFRGPNERRAIRLDYSTDTVEIVSKYNIKDYTIRYLSRPSPIYLIDLDEEHLKSGCLLDPSIHKYILERAVQLAISTRAASNKN